MLLERLLSTQKSFNEKTEEVKENKEVKEQEDIEKLLEKSDSELGLLDGDASFCFAYYECKSSLLVLSSQISYHQRSNR